MKITNESHVPCAISSAFLDWLKEGCTDDILSDCAGILFDLASAAKNCSDYVLANEIFAVLANMSISGAVDVYISYEQDQEDLLENLSDPDGAGYYDLPFLYDESGNYLCIPLPFTSRHFRNHIIRTCSEWQDRLVGGHNRSHWRLSHSAERRETARRELRRRFESLIDEGYRETSARLILREDDEGYRQLSR